MKSQIKIDIQNNRIIVTSSFAKKASEFDSQEYRMLQRCRADYPQFEVIKRTIASKPNKECYKGLTYEYMQRYIELHSGNPKAVMNELSEMLLISQCHSVKYPIIKSWFLKKFPEIAEYGMKDEDPTTAANETIKVVA